MRTGPATAPGTEYRSMAISQQWRKRFLDLHAGRRGETLPLPPGLGRPIALMTTDLHAEVGRVLRGLERLPVFPEYISLGDTVDRGPEPLGANQLLDVISPPAYRLIGNHDAMWFGAGVVPRLAIELVRWLMRYDEEHFLVEEMGISLRPLEDFAEKHFADARGDYKSSRSRAMEAAATYLKIIAEAPSRFPEWRDTQLNDSDLRIRTALFHNNALTSLTAGEKDTFNRLTGKATLSELDREYFYRLMGGLRDFTPEEEAVVMHFLNEFMSNHAYFQLIECMVGRGDVYTTKKVNGTHLLFTHGGLPINSDGSLAEYNGLTGMESFEAIEADIRTVFTAWRWFIETGDRGLLDLDSARIDRLGDLPWGEKSPLYLRQMQTAARAVLHKGSGLFTEPENAFFSKLMPSTDPQFVEHVCRVIAHSFRLDPERLLIVHGHKNNPSGRIEREALGRALGCDAGTSDNYGGRGAFLLIGDRGLQEFSLDTHEFRPIELAHAG